MSTHLGGMRPRRRNCVRARGPRRRNCVRCACPRREEPPSRCAIDLGRARSRGLLNARPCPPPPTPRSSRLLLALPRRHSCNYSPVQHGRRSAVGGRANFPLSRHPPTSSTPSPCSPCAARRAAWCSASARSRRRRWSRACCAAEDTRSSSTSASRCSTWMSLAWSLQHDLLGPRAIALLGLAIAFVGNLMIAAAARSPDSSPYVYALAYGLIGGGGNGCFIGSFQFASLFESQGTRCAVLSSGFNVAGYVYLLLNVPGVSISGFYAGATPPSSPRSPPPSPSRIPTARTSPATRRRCAGPRWDDGAPPRRRRRPPPPRPPPPPRSCPPRARRRHRRSAAASPRRTRRCGVRSGAAGASVLGILRDLRRGRRWWRSGRRARWAPASSSPAPASSTSSGG